MPKKKMRRRKDRENKASDIGLETGHYILVAAGLPPTIPWDRS
jgi:hypothetical protein